MTIAAWPQVHRVKCSLDNYVPMKNFIVNNRNIACLWAGRSSPLIAPGNVTPSSDSNLQILYFFLHLLERIHAAACLQSSRGAGNAPFTYLQYQFRNGSKMVIS